MILHWNGSKWTQVQTAKFKKGTSEFWGLAASGSNFVIAVGDHSLSSNSSDLVERWVKSKGHFVRMTPPAYAGNDNVLWDAAAASSTDAWMVGGIGFGTDTAVAAHWNGSTWTNFSVVNPSLVADNLNGVAMLPTGQAWAVGFEATGIGETGGVLTESYCP